MYTNETSNNVVRAMSDEELLQFLQDREHLQKFRERSFSSVRVCPLMSQLSRGLTNALTSHQWDEALALVPCISVRAYPLIHKDYVMQIVSALSSSGVLEEDRSVERAMVHVSPRAFIGLLEKVAAKYRDKQRRREETNDCDKQFEDDMDLIEEMEKVVPSDVRVRRMRDPLLRCFMGAFRGLLEYHRWRRLTAATCNNDGSGWKGLSVELRSTEAAAVGERARRLLVTAVDSYAPVPCEWVFAPLLDVVHQCHDAKTALDVLRAYVKAHKYHAPALRVALRHLRDAAAAAGPGAGAGTTKEEGTRLELDAMVALAALCPSDDCVLVLTETLLDNPAAFACDGGADWAQAGLRGECNNTLVCVVVESSDGTETTTHKQAYCSLSKAHLEQSLVFVVRALVRLLLSPQWQQRLQPWQLLQRALRTLYGCWLRCWSCGACKASRDAVAACVTVLWWTWWQLHVGPALGDNSRGLGGKSRGLTDNSRGLGDKNCGLADNSRGLGDKSRGIGGKSRGIADNSCGPGDDNRDKNSDGVNAVTQRKLFLYKCIVSHLLCMGGDPAAHERHLLQVTGAAAEARELGAVVRATGAHGDAFTRYSISAATQREKRWGCVVRPPAKAGRPTRTPVVCSPVNQEQSSQTEVSLANTATNVTNTRSTSSQSSTDESSTSSQSSIDESIEPTEVSPVNVSKRRRSTSSQSSTDESIEPTEVLPVNVSNRGRSTSSQSSTDESIEPTEVSPVNVSKRSTSSQSFSSDEPIESTEISTGNTATNVSNKRTKLSQSSFFVYEKPRSTTEVSPLRLTKKVFNKVTKSSQSRHSHVTVMSSQSRQSRVTVTSQSQSRQIYRLKKLAKKLKMKKKLAKKRKKLQMKRKTGDETRFIWSQRKKM